MNAMYHSVFLVGDYPSMNNEMRRFYIDNVKRIFGLLFKYQSILYVCE